MIFRPAHVDCRSWKRPLVHLNKSLFVPLRPPNSRKRLVRQISISHGRAETFRLPDGMRWDIIFKGFRDGVVYLKMKGACSGCPSSTATLRQGIQNLLKHFLPDVQAVEQIEG